MLLVPLWGGRNCWYDYSGFASRFSAYRLGAQILWLPVPDPSSFRKDFCASNAADFFPVSWGLEMVWTLLVTTIAASSPTC
jgi:hypothetical protein